MVRFVVGGKITRAKKIMHGKTSIINHNNSEIYTNIPKNLKQLDITSIVDKSLSKNN